MKKQFFNPWPIKALELHGPELSSNEFGSNEGCVNLDNIIINLEYLAALEQFYRLRKTSGSFVAVFSISSTPTNGPLRLFDPKWAGRDLPYINGNEKDFTLPPGSMVVFPANIWFEFARNSETEKMKIAIASV